MSDTKQEREFSSVEQDALRADVRRLKNGRTMAAVAREMDIANGTLTNWMGGTYQGNNNNIAAQVQAWIFSEAAKKHTRSMIRAAPKFIDTPSAAAFTSVLAHAQYAVDLVMIAGGAGTGKTTSLRRYAEITPNVFVLTAEPCFSTPRMLLDCLAQVLGLTEKYSSQTVSRAIQRRLRGSGGLLIVDEAQHLSSSSLDQLRTLHDLAEVGVALVGNETVYSRLEGHGRQAQFAQLYSRVGMRISRDRPQKKDIEMLLDGWNIEQPEMRRLLVEIARKPGALRGMTKALQLAHMMAEGTDLDVDMIQRAWERVSATKIILQEAA